MYIKKKMKLHDIEKGVDMGVGKREKKTTNANSKHVFFSLGRHVINYYMSVYSNRPKPNTVAMWFEIPLCMYGICHSKCQNLFLRV